MIINGEIYAQKRLQKIPPPGDFSCRKWGFPLDEIHAATWLHRTATAQWATTDQDRWAVFLQGIALGYDHRQQVASSRAFRAVAALHRAYAFWHWRDPRHFPIQPFPSTVEARHHYLPGRWHN